MNSPRLNNHWIYFLTLCNMMEGALYAPITTQGALYMHTFLHPRGRYTHLSPREGCYALLPPRGRYMPCYPQGALYVMLPPGGGRYMPCYPPRACHTHLLPPRAFCSSLVSTESLYGTTIFFLPPVDWSASAWATQHTHTHTHMHR